MKQKLILFFFFIPFLPSFSQTSSEKIKKDDNYYWGEGKAATLELADKKALSDLSNQINVIVESQFQSTTIQSDNKNSENIESTTKTYSKIALFNVDRLVENNKNMFYVLRYISRTNVKEIFEARKNKIFGYTNLAQKAENQLRIGDALKYYYWAYALLQNHPEGNHLTYNPVPGTALSLGIYLQDCIQAILTRLSFEIKSIQDFQSGRLINLNVRIDSLYVKNFDYSYWTGKSWSPLIHSHTGLTNVELFNPFASSTTNIRLKVELKNQSESKIDSDVMSVLEYGKVPLFPRTEFIIQLKNPIQENNNKNKTTQKTVDSCYLKIIDDVHNAIRKKNYSSVKNHFTKEGYDNFERLIHYGNAIILDEQATPEIIHLKNECMVRSFPAIFSFKTNQQRFIENIVYTFNDEKISNICFASSEQTNRDIMSKSEAFGTFEQRYSLLRMLENYKTAYCLEDSEYLEKIFSDNALIIIGKKLEKERPIEGMYPTEDIEYIRLNKSQYIKRLKNIFINNEFVNLKFDEVKIRRGKKEIFGIQLKQHYYSSSYSDSGYLFLMVDLKNTERPYIYVRTWQNEPGQNGTIYGLEMFDTY